MSIFCNINFKISLVCVKVDCVEHRITSRLDYQASHQLFYVDNNPSPFRQCSLSV